MSAPSKLELERFVSTYIYSSEAFLVDEVLRVDPVHREIEARMDTTRLLPVARYQLGDPDIHPRHVSGPDLVLVSGNLGGLHAYFLHGCRWDEGWVGFGNRIHRADFRSLVTIGPPLRLHSKETRAREGPKRVVLRYEFRFWQEDRLVYFGDQSAIFVKDRAFEAD
ncbi:MAG TPA: hypothetical protein VEC38_06140 [Candidatus Binataceae bacterium]|nr:hypothetical protein [Candidatus Binataceae bacterium]